jgi:soluble lytic murein transglycosylase-like protein
MNLLPIGLAALALSLPLSARGQAAIVSFVDKCGVLHLSNVDDDRPGRAAPADSVVTCDAARVKSAANPPTEKWSGYRAIIVQEAARHGIAASLLHAVIAVESAFDPGAVSRRGAGGLMQLMPETAKRYGVANVFDPADNVRAGAQYLAYLLDRFDNNLSLALAAYNAGEGAVIKYSGRIPPYQETVSYVSRVIAAYKMYQSEM